MVNLSYFLDFAKPVPDGSAVCSLPALLNACLPALPTVRCHLCSLSDLSARSDLPSVATAFSACLTCILLVATSTITKISGLDRANF